MGTKLRILLCRDSQSSMAAIQAGPLKANNVILSTIWKLLLLITNNQPLSTVTFQFVFSHCGLVRNETADEATNVALTNLVVLYDECALIPLEAIKAHLKCVMRNCWLKDTSTSHRSVISSTFSDLKSLRHSPRESEVILHQLWSGECGLLGRVRARLKLFGSESCRVVDCMTRLSIIYLGNVLPRKVYGKVWGLRTPTYSTLHWLWAGPPILWMCPGILNGSSSNLTSVETWLENAILAGAVSVRSRR